MVRSGLIALSGALILVAACVSLKEAYADRLFHSGTPSAVRKAAAISPRRAAYWSGLAEALDREGLDPLPAMNAAVKASPHDALLKLQHGLRAEADGEVQQAERDLLAAARLSRKYQPRWTLANFYYRRGGQDAFWQWAREALDISYGDRYPLFDLCWSLSSKADDILKRAIPDRRPVLLDFASYVAERTQYSQGESLVIELAGSAGRSETGYFLYHTDRLLDSWRIPSALAIWNTLSARGLIPYQALKQDGGPLVTNSDFTAPSLGRGFDWRTAAIAGTFASPFRPGGLSIWLSGLQPEQCELISQFLPLTPGKRYRIQTRYRVIPSGSSSSSTQTGVFWAIMDKDHNQIGGSEMSRPGDERNDSFWCALRSREPGARLVLKYQRPQGTARLEGEIRLNSVSVDVAE